VAVVEFQHVKPGKGGASCAPRSRTSCPARSSTRRSTPGTKVENRDRGQAHDAVLVQDGEDYVFMDLDTFDQITVPGGTVGEAADYLLAEAEARSRRTRAFRLTSSCRPASSSR